MTKIKAGDKVKSKENDIATYTVLKVYENKQDKQTYLNIEANMFGMKNVYVKQHISLFEKV